MRVPAVLVLAVVTVLAASVVVGVRLPDDARSFFGPVPPTVAVVAALLAGAGAMRTLDARGWPASGADVVRSDVVLIGTVVVALGVSAIVADLAIGFDEDMNVRWPGSVPFYLVMAVVAEVVFHLIPLAIAASVVGRPPDGGPGSRILAVLAVVASIEAVFQVSVSRADGDATLLTGFVGVQLVLIGLVQVVVYWQLGPWAMVLVRVAYYAIWHIGWGYLRLRVVV